MLNVREKKDAINLCGITGFLDDPAQLKFIRQQSEVKEAIEEIREKVYYILRKLRLKKKDFENIERDLRDGVYQIKVIHASEKVSERRKARKEPITINKGNLEDLIEQTMTLCENCTRAPKRCDLRRVLKKMDIVALDEEKEHGCEYCFKRGDR